MDYKGAAGKSRLSEYLIRNHGAVVLSGKSADMLHGYDNQAIVIIDCPREAVEYFNYGCVETIKDGVYFTGKYTSRMVVRDKPCHVLVFTNVDLDMTKWSADRYVVKYV